jgi:hypothetical protein
MHALHRASLLPLVFALAACTLFGTPKTVPEALALNYATIEAVGNSTTASLTAGSIDADKARDIAGILEQAYSINKLAETAWNANQTTDATSYLSMASSMLTQLEGML